MTACGKWLYFKYLDRACACGAWENEECTDECDCKTGEAK